MPREQFARGGRSPQRFPFTSVAGQESDLVAASAACFLMKESEGWRGNDTPEEKCGGPGKQDP